jgi:hypothetical protein
MLQNICDYKIKGGARILPVDFSRATFVRGERCRSPDDGEVLRSLTYRGHKPENMKIDFIKMAAPQNSEVGCHQSKKRMGSAVEQDR